ncbi:hypothetical protein BC938DRAFT_474940, partial [Jimgerdemannia flammicorona]
MLAATTTHATAPPLPPLRRFRDRSFQAQLVRATCSLILPSERAVGRFPFLRLAHRHTALRWLLGKRAAQQREEGDTSIEACENYNGLLERFAGLGGSEDGMEAVVLRKIIVKELIDTGDAVGAKHFADAWRLTEFADAVGKAGRTKAKVGGYRKDRRISTHPPPNLGADHVSHGVSSSSQHASSAATTVSTYCLPSTVRVEWIRTAADLPLLREILARTELCGIDSEWLPLFGGETAPQRTALVQMACRPSTAGGEVVLLLDVVSLLGRTDEGAIREEVEKVMAVFFADRRVRKI